MDMSATENLKIVKNANQEMLDYFNNSYVEKLELVQRLKTEQFELKVKIDELVKTLDVYSFKSSAGHNVFSPFSATTTSQEEKATQIELKLHDLTEVKFSLDEKIHSIQQEIDEEKLRINSLTDANSRLDRLLTNLNEEFKDMADSEPEEEQEEEEILPVINHGINILRLNEYSKKKLADELTDTILEQLRGNKHKLEILSWMLMSDVNRAKVTLSELIDATDIVSNALDTIIHNLSDNIDINEPLWTLLDDTIFAYKEAHPECVIESDIDCPEYDLNIPEVVTSSLIYIIKELFDNIFKHSNANRVVIKIFISSRLVNVYLNDNGVGIDSNYNHLSPWHSGLHKIQEIIYLLNGQFKIDGDIISGTNVSFSFPVDGNGSDA